MFIIMLIDKLIINVIFLNMYFLIKKYVYIIMIDNILLVLFYNLDCFYESMVNVELELFVV